MKKPLYAVCPRCGRRAKIMKFIWDYEEYETLALVRCVCGTSRLRYAEERVLGIELNDPYLKEKEPFDLLVPPGWNRDTWDKVMADISHW